MASGKRLIDADAFLEKMKRTSRYFDVVFDVEEMPTVDAVEVVRCKDCKWSKRDNLLDKHWCKHFLCESEVRENDYCSYGERRGGDGNG